MIPYFLNLEMMLVQSACVYVWVGVWYTCVHICIIYIYNIYYIYLYHISVEGCRGNQPQYICNSFHHPNLSFLCIRTRVSCKPSEVTFRMGERGKKGKMGNSLILMKSNVCIISWLRFGSILNCEKSDELIKEFPATNWKVFCASVLCLVQNMTIYQLSLYLKLV